MNENVIQVIKRLIKENDKNIDLTSDLLVHYYQSASIEEKKIINKVCMCLTGSHFDIILTRAGIQKNNL